MKKFASVVLVALVSTGLLASPASAKTKSCKAKGGVLVKQVEKAYVNGDYYSKKVYRLPSGKKCIVERAQVTAYLSNA